jgi:hypothetical protein
MKPKILLVALAILFLSHTTGAIAAQTSGGDARSAVKGWLGEDSTPLGARLGG